MPLRTSLRSRLNVLVAAAVLATACGSDNPASPTPTETSTQTPPAATFELAGVVRDGGTNAPVAGARAEIGTDTPQTTGTNGEFTFTGVAAGPIVLRVSKDGYVQSERSMTITANTIIELMLSPVPSNSPPPPPDPQPPPNSPPTPPPSGDSLVMSGTVRNRSTGQGVANAQLTIVDGVNLGRTTSTDGSGAYRFEQMKNGAMRVRVSAADFTTQEIDVPLTGNLTLNFELAPIPSCLYFGFVTDSLGQPVVGATVPSGPNYASTDSTGRYEFRGGCNGGASRVTREGYEAKPVRPTDRFPLYPGGQNITLRRITAVTVAPPSTVKVGSGIQSAGPLISFDSGQTSYPAEEVFNLSSSDSTVLRATSSNYSGGPVIGVEGLKPGTATVTGRYFGVTGSAQVQVVP